MTTKQLTLGNSTIGYDSCKVEVVANGKIRLIAGTIQGRSTVIKKCIANYNKGSHAYLTSAGDLLPFALK